jgi:RNA polymerase sigma-70 factor, ECF subfamily
MEQTFEPTPGHAPDCPCCTWAAGAGPSGPRAGRKEEQPPRPLGRVPLVTPQQQFASLMESVLDRAYRLALHLCRNPDDAADIVQEAALQAFRAFGTFASGTNFRAWFLKIVVNVFRQRCRRSRREPEMVDLQDAPDLYLYTRSRESGLHARSDDPAGQILSRIDGEQISAAIMALPDDYREAAALYFLEELSYAEISSLLDCPVGTVRSRLHRGRKLLQKSLWEIAVEQGIVAELAAEEDRC